jgi:hypothetical protein
VQGEPYRGRNCAHAKGQASAKIDRGGFREMLRRTGHLADAESCVDALRQHLIVEHEIVDILAVGRIVPTRDRQLGMIR